MAVNRPPLHPRLSEWISRPECERHISEKVGGDLRLFFHRGWIFFEKTRTNTISWLFPFSSTRHVFQPSSHAFTLLPLLCPTGARSTLLSVQSIQFTSFPTGADAKWCFTRFPVGVFSPHGAGSSAQSSASRTLSRGVHQLDMLEQLRLHNQRNTAHW